MSRHGNGAIAIFVKTPGLSPIKTRLAAAIGNQAAEHFYTLSVRATQALIEQTLRETSLQELHSITPYWAIAEESGPAHPLWHGFDRISQGTGGLGERLDLVYSKLIAKHDFVLLIGADSPHMSPSPIRKAVVRLCATKYPFVLGPTDDGGFYLFGGRAPLPREVWLNVPYSEASTAESLRRLIQPFGLLTEVDPFFDIDTITDLARLAQFRKCHPPLLPEQNKAVSFAQEVLRQSERTP